MDHKCKHGSMQSMRTNSWQPTRHIVVPIVTEIFITKHPEKGSTERQIILSTILKSHFDAIHIDNTQAPR